MSKFAVYSDLHLHAWEYGSSINESGFNSRLAMQGLFLSSFSIYCTANNIKHIFFCGDYFHTHGRLFTDTLHIAHNNVKEMDSRNIHQYMLVGNHDIYRNFTDYPLSPNSLDVLSTHARIIDRPIIGAEFPELNMVASMIPYTSDKQILIRELNLVRQVRSSKPHFLFLHQGVAGVPIGSGYLINEILSPDMIPDNVMRAFTGHYHTHKDLGKLVIVGPPMQHTWSDKNEEGGILVVDSQTGDFERVQILKSSPKFIELDASFLDLAIQLGKNENVENLLIGNFIRIKNIKTNPMIAEEYKKTILELGAKSVELQYIDIEESPKITNSETFSVEAVLNSFNKTLNERQIKVGEQLRKDNYAIPSF